MTNQEKLLNKLTNNSNLSVDLENVGDTVIPSSGTEELPIVTNTSDPFDVDPKQFEQAVMRRNRNHNFLLGMVNKHFKEKVHYNVIQGRKSMSKAGAEYVRTLLALTPKFLELESYVEASAKKQAIEQVVIICKLFSTNGDLVSTGIGSRNTKQDREDLNKSLKMASKSAFIHAILFLGLSTYYTLDLEDMPKVKDDEGHIEKVLLAFASIGVSSDMIEKHLDIPSVQNMEADDLAHLRQVYKSIKSGQDKVEDYFEE